MKNKPTTDYIQGTIDRISNTVKNGKLKIKRKKLKEKVFHDNGVDIPNPKRELICKNARKKAHNAVANAKREVSNDVRSDLHVKED